MTADLTARITEILREHFCEYIGGTCLCGEPFVRLRDHSDHVAALIAEVAEQHYRPKVETVEQLLALPAHQLIVDRLGVGRQKQERTDLAQSWTSPHSTGVWPNQVPLPAIALWSPGAGE